MTVYLRKEIEPRCQRRGKFTERMPNALYCWDCKPIVDRDNTLKRKKKKKRALKKAMKKPS